MLRRKAEVLQEIEAVDVQGLEGDPLKQAPHVQEQRAAAERARASDEGGPGDHRWNA
jgi:hypothetical protein